MKKYLAMSLFGILFFLPGKAKAGLPFDQMTTSRISYSVPVGTATPTLTTLPIASNWNTSLAGSSAPVAGSPATVVFPIFQTTVTFNSGLTTSTYTARNCITDITVTLSNASTFYILDGGTTDYAIYGSAIIDFSGATTGEWSKHWDHLGPFCGTAGNSLTLSIPAPAPNTATNAINADGYTVITGLAAIYNQNQ